LDSKLKYFYSGTVFTVVALVFTIFTLVAFYTYQNIRAYNYILLALLAIIIFVTLMFVAAVLMVMHVYRHKRVDRRLLRFTRMSLHFSLPLVYLASRISKVSKDVMRGFYIDVNNIIVESTGTRYMPGDVLLLLPHCLQDSRCQHKITNDIGNCRRCGNCCIGELAELSEKLGVKIFVATGGTAARNIICRSNPGFVFSVACERDLFSGIRDMKNVPVIGMLNERPKGPCNNTVVNVRELEKKLRKMLLDDID